MEFMSSTFSQHSLPYKMPIHFNNLDIGGIFHCYKMPLRSQPLRIQGRTLLLQNANVVFKSCTCKGPPLLQNAMLVSTRLASTNINQASSFIFITDQYRSCIIMQRYPFWAAQPCYPRAVYRAVKNGRAWILPDSVPTKCPVVVKKIFIELHTHSLQHASVVLQIQGLDHIILLQNARLMLTRPSEAHHIFFHNSTAILMIA